MTVKLSQPLKIPMKKLLMKTKKLLMKSKKLKKLKIKK